MEISKMQDAIVFVPKQTFVPVDVWEPEEKDIHFRHIKGHIILDVSSFYGSPPSALDLFNLTEKKCYNYDEMRKHTCRYLNYFLKYYDIDKELLMVYHRIKMLIDVFEEYDHKAFVGDIITYIMSPSMRYKVELMNEDNYALSLTDRAKIDANLKYTDKHGKVLMRISLFMNILIPLVTHFIHKKGIRDSSEYFLEIYDIIMNIEDVDIYNKLYETASSTTTKSERAHGTLWDKQDIRGKNGTTHAMDSVINMVLNIMPKYRYDENIVHFNYQSIRKHTGFQITNISYEYVFIPLSGSDAGGEGQQSSFDKFESYMIKTDCGSVPRCRNAA